MKPKHPPGGLPQLGLDPGGPPSLVFEGRRGPGRKPEAAILLVSARESLIAVVRDCVAGIQAEDTVLRHTPDLAGVSDYADGRRVAVLLLDLAIAEPPQLQGLDQCRRLLPHLPIVIVADSGDEAQARLAVSRGALDYLVTSELSPRLLERTLRYCLARRSLTLPAGGALDLLQEILPVPVIICSRDDGAVLFANTKVGPTFGLTSKQLLDQSLSPFMVEPATLPFFEQTLEEVGFFDDYETEMRRRDGSRREVRISGLALDYAGKLAMLLVINDVTVSRQAESTLRSLEASLREFFEENLTANFRAAAGGQLIACNRAFTGLFGLAADGEARSWNLRALHPTEDGFRQFLGELESKRRLDHYETQLQRTDGSRVDVIQNIVGKFDDSGRLREIRGYVFDTTEHKRTERQLRQSQKMEAVGLLAGGIAHDFNNLLTAISGYSELLLTRIDEDSPLRREVEEIRKAGSRAAALTRQLLAFSRRQILQPEFINLNEVVVEMEGMLRRLIDENIALITTLDSELGFVRADRGQIEQVIANLVVNARDAMPRGGRVTIETARIDIGRALLRQGAEVPAGSYVSLRVTDTGVGIDAETIPRIFEPFFTTKEKGKGTGLGLSTVYGIVKQSSGFIFVDSEENVGTNFEIYLTRQEQALPRPKPEPLRRPRVGGTETILLVEDEAAVRELASLTLQMKGYRLLVAENGEQALQLCHQHCDEIDLIVTDVVMPQMSGRELAKRALELKPELRVLFLSGYTDEAIGHPNQLESNVAFMGKPFTPSSLAQKVRQVLDVGSDPPESTD